MSPTEEAAAVFTRIFEALARQNGKTLSARTRDDIEHACSLLSNAAADLDVLDDLPEPARRVSPVDADPDFQRWRARRAVEV